MFAFWTLKISHWRVPTASKQSFWRVSSARPLRIITTLFFDLTTVEVLRLAALGIDKNMMKLNCCAGQFAIASLAAALLFAACTFATEFSIKLRRALARSGRKAHLEKFELRGKIELVRESFRCSAAGFAH